MIKKCQKCGQYLSLSKFSKNKKKRDGLQDWCILCMILQKYNLSEREYTDLVQRANGCCEICGISPSTLKVQTLTRRSSTLHIDHCHSTLKVRGLLCFNCNIGLGSFRDNIETLNNAITYLEKECS